jgi:hypothetical protein
MEDINNRGRGSATNTRETKLIQPRLIIQALAFTGILHFCAGQTPPKTTGVIFSSVETSAPLAVSVKNSVLRHASQQSGLPPSALHIVHAQPQTWSDNCLGLSNPEVLCTQMAVPGWQIAVASGQQHWLYRTNTSGSAIKAER